MTQEEHSGSAKAQIAANVRIHDRIAKNYERTHGEIYSQVEQERLRAALATALSFLRTGSSAIRALDFGCGAGNVTAHLSALGCEVIASDVSQGFLDLVDSKQFPNPVSTLLLNGNDLSNVEDRSIDLISTYSVLHHVPDYLGVIEEFARVLKPGGVLLIDHEASEDFWAPNPIRQELRALTRKKKVKRRTRFLDPRTYYYWLRSRLNPRFRPEGDIHVFADDHIEWPRIVGILNARGVEVVIEEDYLVYRDIYGESTYEKYRSLLSDMHMLIARKQT